MRDLGFGRVRFNRHDFKRGTPDSPPELTCRGCGADLGLNTVQVFEHIPQPLYGVLEPGCENGVVLRVYRTKNHSMSIICMECGEDHKVQIEDWYFDREAIIGDEDDEVPTELYPSPG